MFDSTCFAHGASCAALAGLHVSSLRRLGESLTSGVPLTAPGGDTVTLASTGSPPPLRYGSRRFERSNRSSRYAVDLLTKYAATRCSPAFTCVLNFSSGR